MTPNLPVDYMRNLINEFQIPNEDKIIECLLIDKSSQEPIWDAGVFISDEQAGKFYSDIFHFWVRSFFCFVEDLWLGSMLQDRAPDIICTPISPDEFRIHYLKLLHERCLSPDFIETQEFPGTYTELEKRSFTNAYIILDLPNIKSSVANSDGEYLAYFHIKPGKLSDLRHWAEIQ